MYSRMFESGEPLTHQGVVYFTFMRLLNQHLQPRSYFEIGTQTGQSLDCFGCDAVCVDPKFQINGAVWQARRRTFLFQTTSDDFFAKDDLRAYFPDGPDISFLDGMHRSEYLLRDFINTERTAHRRSLILMHDCLPLNARMAELFPRMGDESEPAGLRNAWTGDVWRVLFILKKLRPDLSVLYLDCPPTGLIAIGNLNPDSTVLKDHYDDIVAEMHASHRRTASCSRFGASIPSWTPGRWSPMSTISSAC